MKKTTGTGVSIPGSAAVWGKGLTEIPRKNPIVPNHPEEAGVAQLVL
jgi:hypothetical protein